MEELNKHKAMKEEIRSNTKKKLKTEEEESLIETGRQEARDSFWKLVEKNKTLSLFPVCEIGENINENYVNNHD